MPHWETPPGRFGKHRTTRSISRLTGPQMAGMRAAIVNLPDVTVRVIG